MKKYFLILVCGLFYGSLSAQNFPEKSEFGGVEIGFSPAARSFIDQKVSELKQDTALLGKINRNARLYLPFIHRELKNAFFPTDFVYYAAQMSDFDPENTGPAGGKGFWDFDATRAGYAHLRITDSEDERMHPISAAAGFVEFANFNKRQFENWGLVLISLYKGIPEVKQTYKYADLQHHKKFQLGDTEAETLLFFALREVLRPEFLKIMSSTRVLRSAEAQVGDQIAVLAKKHGISESILKKLNPWLVSNRLPENNSIILPADPSAPVKPDIYPVIVFPKNKNADDQDLSLFTANGLPGISFSADLSAEAAGRYAEIDASKLLKYNDLPDNSPIKARQIYYLKNKNKKAATARHTLQRNETLWDVSQKYGLRLSSLHKNNRINERSPIKAGLVLWLNAKRPSSEAPVYETLPELKKEEPIENVVHIDPTVISEAAEDTVKKIVPQETEIAAVVPDIPNGYHSGSHYVRPEDTWVSIADKYGMTVSDLKLINPNSKNDLSLVVNSSIDVWEADEPEEEDTTVSESTNTEENSGDSEVRPQDQANEQDNNNGNGQLATETTVVQQEPVEVQVAEGDYHSMQKGQTLFGVSKAYGVSVDKLMAWNNLNKETVKKLTAGQQIRVRELPEPAPAAGNSGETEEVKRDRYGRRYHDVRKGETTQSVARKYLVSVYDLEAWNHLGKNQKLPAECRLYLEDTPPALAQRTHHIIEKNETLFSVSRLYNMPVSRIMELNRMSPETRNVLLGTKLRIREDDEVTGTIVNEGDNTSVMSQTTQSTGNESTEIRQVPTQKNEANQPQTGIPSPSPFSITDDIVDDNVSVPQKQTQSLSFMKPQNTGYTEQEAAKTPVPEVKTEIPVKTEEPSERLTSSASGMNETPEETQPAAGGEQKTLPDDYYYKTSFGESLLAVSKAAGVSTDDLKKWNPGVTDTFVSGFTPTSLIIKDPNK